MAVTLKDLYDAFNAGAGRATLLRLVEELERNRIAIPPDLRQEIAEMTDVEDDERGGV